MKKLAVRLLLALGFLALVILLAAGVTNAQEANGQEPVLEIYTLSHGGTPSARPDGLTVKLSDNYFGNGTARAQLRLKTKGDFGSLFLNVYREVVPGEVAFALLVFRVEVRGYDSAGSVIYSRDLDGFSFRDSRSGEWQELLEDIPVSIKQLKVVFIGNYE